MRDQIVARIRRLGEGKAFSAKDFLDIGSRTTVDVTLHAEYFRPPEKPLLDRYSRHYYDVAMMAKGPIKTDALGDMALLAQVVKHKETFYPSAWSRYDLAQRGGLHLLPVKERMQAIERDYRKMGVMIFGEPPPLDGIMETLNTLEKEINK
jgi:Nucleotidyl transferase AbiEii toxin, Type IV TA system